MEIKISYKKENADFIENKMSAERAEQLFGEDWIEIIEQSTTAIEDRFNERILIYKNQFGRTQKDKKSGDLSGKMLLTNEQVIEELLQLAKQIQAAQQEGQKLGLTADELAFYDALTKPQAIKDFYENEELIAITKELADALRKNKTIDWQKRDSARAKMRMMIKKLLKKHKYPPEGMDDAVQTVMLQCELWTDNNDMTEERVSNYAARLGEYVSEINKQ